MKILHTVEFYYPSVGGAQEVVRQLSERMVKAGHEVTVATTKLPNRTSLIHNGVNIVEFDIKGNEVNGIYGNKKEYHDFLLSNKFDVIMNYAAQEWTADLFFQVMDKVKAKKVFVPCGYSALYDPHYSTYFKKMPNILKKYDATIYLSYDYRDINFAKQHNIKNIHVIPNGADENEFMRLPSHEDKRRIKNTYGLGGLVIMSIGNYTGEKGHVELIKMFKKLPISKATLVTAGTIKPHDGCFDWFEEQAWIINQGRKYIGKRVVMLDGSNRAAVRDVLKTADLFVFLSNIEASPLVMFEAAASAVPFIATAAGNNREIADWTKGGVIVKTHQRDNGRVQADTKDTLWQVTRFAHRKDLRASYGNNGRKAWQKKYTWEKITQQYLDLYKEIQKGTKK